MVLELREGQLCFDEQLLLNIQEMNNDAVLPILTDGVICNNVSDDAGATLLHFASLFGNAEIAEKLLHLGMNVNARDKWRQTPLLLAVTNYANHMSTWTIKILLKAGANIFEADVDGKYPLQQIVDNRRFSSISVVKEFFEILREYCENNDTVMADHLMKVQCPLERAMYLRSAPVTEIMINNSSEIDAPNPHNGYTALHVATSNIDEPNVKLLLACGANATARTRNGNLPLLRYFIGTNRPPHCRNLEIVKALLSHYFTVSDNKEDTKISLQHILKWGSEEEIRCMLQYDIDFSTKKEYGEGLMHWLAENPHPNVAKPFEDKFNDVHLRSLREATPLHYVTHMTDPNTVKFLLRRGADVNARTIRGYTPLSAFFIDLPNTHFPGEKEIVNLLLQSGADIQVVIPESQETIFDFIIETQRFNFGELFVTRLVLLEKLGKPIIDLVRSKIDAYQNFKTHYDLCQRRLENMKKITIYESITLFKLLSQSEKEIIKRYAYNDELLEEFENFDAKYVSNKSNYYYDILSARVESVLPKIKLIRDATKIIFNRIVPQLNNNYLVTRKIIDCLSYDDMKVLIHI